ncbi:MAG: sulfatase [Planctomycetota bacterium]
MRSLLMLFALGSATAAAESFAAERPNFVLILTDDQGWSQVSEVMNPRVPESRSTYLETPNMARLMREGMRFTSGYSPAPLCTPTRRSILCGTSAARSGSEFRSTWVPADHMTIPKALKQASADYRCAHFGKWGEQMISTPEQCGYDASDGETGNNTGGMPGTLGVAGGHEQGPPHFIDNDDPKRTRTVTDRAIQFMREQSEARHPFYVQVSYYAVHLSVVCREETLKKYQAKGEPDRAYPQAWAAMMDELDTGIGRLLTALDEMKLADNTYVIFTADNGGRGTVPGADRGAPPNQPLTGAKHDLFEGGIRVPFVVRGPGIAAGSLCHSPVAGYDFLPTFYDLAGGTAPLTPEIDGGSFRALLSDPQGGKVTRPQPALIFHRPARKESVVRQGDYKLRLIWAPTGEIAGRELVCVNPDPREEGRNIADKEPARADAMQEVLLGYLKSVDAEKPTETKRGAKKGKAAAKKGRKAAAE